MCILARKERFFLWEKNTKNTNKYKTANGKKNSKAKVVKKYV